MKIICEMVRKSTIFINSIIFLQMSTSLIDINFQSGGLGTILSGTNKFVVC